MFLCKFYLITNYSRISVIFFFSKYIFDYYKKLKQYYYCPLGEEKFNIDELKFKEDNLKLLKIIELEHEEADLMNKSKIAEDEEYEYYVEEENLNKN